jgi:molybdopterin converting factor small subunit
MHYAIRNQKDAIPMAIVFVPTPLRRLTGGQSKVTIEAATVNDIIATLEETYPGEVKKFINIFVDGEEIRALQGGATPISEKSEVSIIPAMAGGQALE